MNFECLMNVDAFSNADQKTNVLVGVVSVYKNGDQFLIEANVKNAQTLEVIKHITTDFVPTNIDGNLKTQAVDHLKSMFN